MAWTSGTATNYLDLVRRLRDFLLTDPTLVGLGQNWQQISAAGELGGLSPAPTAPTLVATNQIMLQGPGLSGDDEILVSLQFSENVGLNRYNIGVRGQTSYMPSVTAGVQAGASAACWMLCINAPMRYWFIANGRRFIVITQANAQYEQMYAGFILPEHLPEDWPYPMFVGACANVDTLQNTSVADAHSAYWNPYMQSTAIDGSANAYLCGPDLNWRPIANTNPSSTTTYNVMTAWGPYVGRSNYRQSISGLPIVVQGDLFTASAAIGRAYFGRFDGVYELAAFGMTPELTATIDGVDYIAIPNVFRVSDGNYCAYPLT